MCVRRRGASKWNSERGMRHNLLFYPAFMIDNFLLARNLSQVFYEHLELQRALHVHTRFLILHY